MYTRFHCGEMRMECFTLFDILCLKLWKQQRYKHHLTTHYDYVVLVITMILLHGMIKSHRAPLLSLAGNINTTKWHPLSARRILCLMQYTSKLDSVHLKFTCVCLLILLVSYSAHNYDGCVEIRKSYHIWFFFFLFNRITPPASRVACSH